MWGIDDRSWNGAAKLKISMILTGRQAIAPSTIDFSTLHFIAGTEFAELEHGRDWMGLEGAREISASRPPVAGEIPGERFAEVFAANKPASEIDLLGAPFSTLLFAAPVSNAKLWV